MNVRFGLCLVAALGLSAAFLFHPGSASTPAPSEKTPLTELEASASTSRFPGNPGLFEDTPPELLRDGLARGRVREALAQSGHRLEQEPELMPIILSAFRVETNTAMIPLLAELIKSYARTNDYPFILEIAQTDPLSEKRKAALDVLLGQPQLPGQASATLHHIGGEDPKADVPGGDGSPFP